MPDIPETTAQVAPQVQPSAALPMDVTPAALGAGLGEATEMGAEVASKIHHDAMARANQTAVMDADNQRNAFLQARLYDAKTGILNQNLGKDAPGAVDQVLSDYDGHVAKVSDGLTNDEQKIQFQRIAQASRFDLQRQLAHYEHGETTRYADEVDQAAVANTTTAAVHNAHDAEQVGVELEKQKAIIADAGQRKGYAPEAIAAQQQAAASATHLAVLEQLTATGQDVAAQHWYDAHKDDLTAKDGIAAARLVEAGSLAGQAQRTTDRIVLGKDGEIDTRAAIDERVRQIDDPRLRDAVQTRVDQRLAQHHQEHEEDQRQTIQNVLTAAQGDARGIYAPAAVAGMAKLDPENAAKVQSYFQKDGLIHTDQGAMNLLVQMAHDDPGSFVKALRDPAVALKYAPTDYEKLLSMRDEIGKNGAVGKVGADLESDQRIVGNQLHDLGLDKDLNGDAANLFRSRYDLAKRAAIDANQGKALSEDDKRALARTLAADHAVTVMRGWYNPARWVGDATTKDSDGKLYTKDQSTVLNEIPLPGTFSEQTGEGMSHADLVGWVRTLTAPQVGDAAKAQLARMRAGTRADGTYDPALAARYALIKRAVRDAQDQKAKTAKASP